MLYLLRAQDSLRASAMQAWFDALGDGPLPRREIKLLTAFTGPGGRDAVECVTRALTNGRYQVDRALGGKDVISDLPGPCLCRFTLGARPPRSPSAPAMCCRNSWPCGRDDGAGRGAGRGRRR